MVRKPLRRILTTAAAGAVAILVFTPITALALPPDPQSIPPIAQQWEGLSSSNDGTGSLSNDTRSSNRALHWGHQTFGVDLDWINGPSLWRVEGQRGPQLTRGEPVALRVWGGGWLKYGHQTWGVDLDLSDTPSYEWYVLGGPPGRPLSGGTFALWNAAANDYLVAGHQTFGVDLNWYKKTVPDPPPLPPARQISLTKEGAGASTVFVVKGVGFTPNVLAVIRVTDPRFQQRQFVESVGRDGTFASRDSVPCGSGIQLTVTAFEDPDPVHTFANAIVTNCP
jgi:hypothetical protein